MVNEDEMLMSMFGNHLYPYLHLRLTSTTANGMDSLYSRALTGHSFSFSFSIGQNRIGQDILNAISHPSPSRLWPYTPYPIPYTL